MDSLFLKACRSEPAARTPIWLMRQAGRYMKSYRDVRAKMEFLELCKNPEMAAYVTVDAVQQLGVDAAIIFSDILLILEPLGFQLSYGKDQGPRIANPFEGKTGLKKLSEANPADSLSFVFDAIQKTVKELPADIPLIGFAGAPFTVAAYAIEGGGSKNFVKTKSLMLSDPEGWHGFMEKISNATIQYLNAQVDAGAHVIQLFDSWVGCLSPDDYSDFVFPYTQKITRGIKPGVPVINFGTQTTGLFPQFKDLGGQVVGVDWRVDLDWAWNILGDTAIQGNFDPVILFSSKPEIKEAAERILKQANGRPGHIFNLGHGVLPKTPEDNVKYLVQVVKEYGK